MTIPTAIDNATITGLDQETLKTVGVKSVEYPNNFVRFFTVISHLYR